MQSPTPEQQQMIDRYVEFTRKTEDFMLFMETGIGALIREYEEKNPDPAWTMTTGTTKKAMVLNAAQLCGALYHSLQHRYYDLATMKVGDEEKVGDPFAGMFDNIAPQGDLTNG